MNISAKIAVFKHTYHCLVFFQMSTKVFRELSPDIALVLQHWQVKERVSDLTLC